ncbi:MAG: RHS repeat-associated core domain-containing protein, partial [Bacteroidales bacterium]
SASSDNPFRFSSEVYDDSFGLVYYNYRHYHSQDGRWARRDPQEEMERFGAYGFVRNCPVSLFDFVGLDIIDNIINELKQNENTLKDLSCTFIFAVDRPNGNKFSTKNVEERLRKAITDPFPKAKISIQEKENFNAPDVIGALNAPECVCGFFYIGHVGINDGRPRIIFDRNRTSIGSYISAGQETPDHHKLDEISGKNFSKSAVSGIIGCNSAVSSSIGGGCSSHTISSFAQTFAQHTGASTWGSTTGVNFNPDGQVTRGGFWDSEENGRSFK